MREIFNLILKLSIGEWLDLIKIFLTFIPGMVWKLLKPDIWIFSERPKEARDNAFWVFDYVLKNKLHNDAFYALTDDSPDLKKLSKYKKNIVKYGSFKHFAAIWACSKYISAHVDDGYPSPRVCYKLKMFGIYRFKFIFLQHGVVHNYHDFYAEKNTHAEKIICSAKKEHDFLIKKCGYHGRSVECVGLARFDGLVDVPKTNNEVLIFPTWRRNLVDYSQKKFEKSNFFKNFHNLLTDNALLTFAEKNKISINFFLHKEFQKFYDCFKSLEHDNLKILNNQLYDIQDELKKASFLVTDYSSVAFDFAYMYKPLVYFQFDYFDFRTNHTQKGYFNYEENGFGKVCKNFDEVTDAIITSYKQNFKLEKKFFMRDKDFFLHHDNKNSERNFEVIQFC